MSANFLVIKNTPINPKKPAIIIIPHWLRVGISVGGPQSPLAGHVVTSGKNGAVHVAAVVVAHALADV